MNKQYFKEIKKYVTLAKANKQKYRDNIQCALEIFLARYNEGLSHNTQPLVDIVEAVGNDNKFLRVYLGKAITNLERIDKTDNNGLKFVLKKIENTKSIDIVIDNEYIDNTKWYDSLEKADKQAINDFADINAVIKVFNMFRGKLLNSVDKLGIQQATVNKLEELHGQLQAYKVAQ